MCLILCLLVIAAFVASTQQQEFELNSNDTTESSGQVRTSNILLTMTKLNPHPSNVHV